MYNQDTGQEFQDFDATVTLLVEALKLKDKDLVKIYKQTLSDVVGNEEATNILNAAMHQLAGASPEICHWAADNLPELQVCTDLQHHVCMFTVQKLINNGFILGKDFSTNVNCKILVRRDIRVSLMLDCSQSEWKFIKSVVQITE